MGSVNISATDVRRFATTALAEVLLALCVSGTAQAAPAPVRNYDLGRVDLPAPGPKGPLPTRLWGAIGAPQGAGPHPVVLVLHGRHGTGCPTGRFDAATWPCFRREQRNDLGLHHVVAGLARRGFVALAPDLNAAFTDGWGEPDDRHRWPLVVNRTLAELADEAASGGGRFQLALQGRVNLRRLGLLGHSLSGFHAVRAARRRADNGSPAKVAAGRGPIRALFLLAPVRSALAAPDVPLAVALGTCDGDTGTEGRIYFNRARQTPARGAPAFLVSVRRANHNFYNRTLARLSADDAPTGQRRCRRPQRPSAGEQQRWIAAAAADFFAAMIRRARRPVWLRLRARPPSRVHGLDVVVRRSRGGSEPLVEH
jgi:dienelactone hydrolase